MQFKRCIKVKPVLFQNRFFEKSALEYLSVYITLCTQIFLEKVSIKCKIIQIKCMNQREIQFK